MIGQEVTDPVVGPANISKDTSEQENDSTLVAKPGNGIIVHMNPPSKKTGARRMKKRNPRRSENPNSKALRISCYRSHLLSL